MSTCVQLANMMLNLGAALVPQMVKPFLGDHRHFSKDSIYTDTSNITLGMKLKNINLPSEKMGRVQYGYLTIACINICLGFVSVIMF